MEPEWYEVHECMAIVGIETTGNYLIDRNIRYSSTLVQV